MSRGPGRWQRAILEACRERVDPETGFPGWVTVEEVIVNVDRVSNASHGQRLSRSQREAVRRAMRTLAADGKVEAGRRMVPAPTTRRYVHEFAHGKVRWPETRMETREGLVARMPLSAEQRDAERRAATSLAELEAIIGRRRASA